MQDFDGGNEVHYEKCGSVEDEKFVKYITLF